MKPYQPLSAADYVRPPSLLPDRQLASPSFLGAHRCPSLPGYRAGLAPPTQQQQQEQQIETTCEHMTATVVQEH